MRLTPDLLQENLYSDTLFQLEKGGQGTIQAKTKEAVTKVSGSLHAHDTFTEPFVAVHRSPASTFELIGVCHDLLTTIQTEMLIVDLRDRRSSVKIWTSIHRMSERCETDTEYAIKGVSHRVNITHTPKEIIPQTVGLPNKTRKLTSNMSSARAPTAGSKGDDNWVSNPFSMLPVRQATLIDSSKQSKNYPVSPILTSCCNTVGNMQRCTQLISRLPYLPARLLG